MDANCNFMDHKNVIAMPKESSYIFIKLRKFCFNWCKVNSQWLDIGENSELDEISHEDSGIKLINKL
jgi:hypothetical protein